MGDHGVIVGTGTYIPERVVRNSDFLRKTFYPDGSVLDKPTVFYDPNGKALERPTVEIIEKFEQITGIFERRFVLAEQSLADIATLAAKDALDSSGIPAESLDGIIVAHDSVMPQNSGAVVPSIASQVKQKLGIQNPNMNNYDITAGCPGWVKGVVNASNSILVGQVKKMLVVGAEIVSCFLDPHDQNSMIFSDGAGAVVVEVIQSETPAGILSYATESHSIDRVFWTSRSFNPEYYGSRLFIKMNGRKVYEYVVRRVPEVIKASLDKAGLHIDDIKIVFMHQANEKMNQAALERLYGMYSRKVPQNAAPMTISWLGNSSVATVPTLIDFVFKDKFGDYRLKQGDYIVIASVGAGMNIDSVVYRMHR